MSKIKLMFGLLLCFGVVQAQDDITEKANKEAEKALQTSTNITYEANDKLTSNDFVTAEADYRRAISKSNKNAAARFNLGNAYYNRESFGEAFGRFKEAGDATEDKGEKHKAFHNMGNVFMKQKDYKQAVEAYKQALRKNPNDDETRYNLALAKKMLEKQQDEQKNDQNQDNQDKKDQENEDKDKNQDQNNEGGDNEKKDEGEQKEDENKDKGDKGDNGEDKPKENQEGDGDKKKEQEKKPNEGDQPEDKKQQPRPNQLSEQQIQNLLEAMQNEEKKVQEKMEARKVRGKKVKNEKDW
ncbi:tetratricopeptide repeat protein [Muricauda sp. 334s03]|uniref:Tetratricopeptide repeat protein n=2 Tax=Flagellimonas yonaguniensis TaxID=3031325 RepID=A0ABT5XUW7_9FLAO|nr:tetratricopeptide repeat protein [[Muricauda] yonaguniensis]MDF0714982.1 tetratricopeptide repeat protein [[Muricauda] yonaguniensis]